MEHLDEIKKLVVESTKTKFYLYKRLCELVLKRRVTEESCSFIVEIDAEENKNLMDKKYWEKFLIKIIKRTRANKKKVLIQKLETYS